MLTDGIYPASMDFGGGMCFGGLILESSFVVFVSHPFKYDGDDHNFFSFDGVC